MTGSVVVVVPVYLNRDTLGELHRRLADALEGEPELCFVYVVDGSPDDSADVLAGIAAEDGRVSVLDLDRNVGQHRAVLAGLAHAPADWAVVLDADLQDPPEAVPRLLEAARAGGWEVTFAGREGPYQSRPRRITSWFYKNTIAALTGLPSRASLFLVLSRGAVERLLAMEGPEPMVTAMIGAARLRWTTVPVRRDRRPTGASAYSPVARARVAWRGLRWAVVYRAKRPRGRGYASDDGSG